jgi:hypothetical protein
VTIVTPRFGDVLQESYAFVTASTVSRAREKRSSGSRVTNAYAASLKRGVNDTLGSNASIPSA